MLCALALYGTQQRCGSTKMRAHAYNIRVSTSRIDNRLSELQPVFKMSRLPRSLTHRKYWRSSEWRKWLLFFSPVVLPGILPQPYYDK